ncbi:hypothetical protein [Nonomuraea sp. NPDC049480]|uniref:hypothetical protein n=1 Tax=Nonomuraea sp. NPDC049480 TaxID=3364353 RepID=UPI00379A05AB
MTTGLDREGFEFFSASSARAQGDGLLPALAGTFQSRLEGQAEAAIAKLDAATSLDLGLPRYFRGISLARLPECAATRPWAGRFLGSPGALMASSAA